MSGKEVGEVIGYAIGLDVGQPGDTTAVAVLQRVSGPLENGKQDSYNVQHLHRFPIGTASPAIVENVRELIQHPELSQFSGQDGTASSIRLVVNVTMVGDPFVQGFKDAGLRPHPVIIHSGSEVGERMDGGYAVPRVHLTTQLRLALEEHRLKIAIGLEHASTLTQDLLSLPVKNLGASENPRERPNDDLVFAVAIAVWRECLNPRRTWEFLVCNS